MTPELLDFIKTLASRAAQATSLTRAVVGHVADRGRIAPPEVQAQRLTICQACPHATGGKAATGCTVCGCRMEIKRSWSSSQCPLPEPKWSRV